MPVKEDAAMVETYWLSLGSKPPPVFPQRAGSTTASITLKFLTCTAAVSVLRTVITGCDALSRASL